MWPLSKRHQRNSAVLSYFLMTAYSNSIKQSLIFMDLGVFCFVLFCFSVMGGASQQILFTHYLGLNSSELWKTTKVSQPVCSHSFKYHLHNKEFEHYKPCFLVPSPELHVYITYLHLNIPQSFDISSLSLKFTMAQLISPVFSLIN
jgi:hypothetical protein